MQMRFSIKTSKNFTEGLEFVYKSIQTARYLSEDLRNFVDHVIEGNGFFTHPEHL